MIDSSLVGAISMYLAADFTASPTSGTAPLKVHFTDRSEGTVCSRLWRFGDGEVAFSKDPSHVYESPGVYSVSETVASHPGADTAQRDDYIWVGFRDVPPGHWAFAPVLRCVDEGLVYGYPDGLYRPSWTVSRGQMAVYISRALAGDDTSVPTGPSSPSFGDVGPEHWAFKYVEYALDQGVVMGYGDGLYRPDSDLSRGQVAAFIARALAGSDADVPPGPATPGFLDVPTDHWAYRYVEYILDEGVTTGYEDGGYHPEEQCRRDQMAVFVLRAFGLPIAGPTEGGRR